MSASYKEFLDFECGATLSVDFTTWRGKVIDYSVVLLLPAIDGVETIRVYDAAHGFNEMHRYTQAGGKQE